MAALEGVRVVRSSIHGYGGVTTRPARAGEILCYGDGVLYRAGDEFDDTYCLILPGEDAGPGETGVCFYDLVDQTRWFNHSCDPNTEVLAKWDPELKAVRAWWRALRDIAAGEEITYDYAFVGDVAEPCACGAASCRGVIVDPDPEELAKLAPNLRALLRIAA